MELNKYEILMGDILRDLTYGKDPDYTELKLNGSLIIEKELINDTTLTVMTWISNTDSKVINITYIDRKNFLKKELEKAIKREDFENASKLQEKIKKYNK